MASTTAISVRDLVVDHQTSNGVLRALNCAALTVDTGTSLAVTGPSGCGKSTLLGVLAGLASPTSGEVWFGPTHITGLPKSAMTDFRRRTLGVVYQADNLLPFLTITENLALQLQLSNSGVDAPTDPAGERIDSVLESLAITDTANRFPDQLSGGQRQRAAIARAIVHRPTVILADEPTGALDAANATGVIDVLLAMQRELHATLVLVTHDHSIAQQLQRTIQLHLGARFHEGENGDVR